MNAPLLARASLAAILALTSPGLLHAQGKIQHSGFYFGAGLGIGWAKYNGDAEDGTTESGFSGTLRLGGHLRPNWLLGGETNGWYKSEDGGTGTWGDVMATTYLYPSKSLSLFIKGGLGYMYTSISDDFNDISSSHFAIQFGTGYDIRIAKGSAISIYFNWIKGFSGAIDVNGFEAGDVSPSILQLGAAFSLY